MGSFSSYDLAEGSSLELGEDRLRRQLDRAVGRALIDAVYRDRLLAEPTLALDGLGCTPKQYLDVRAIRAPSLQQFAVQAQGLFWPRVSEELAAHRPAVAAVG